MAIENILKQRRKISKGMYIKQILRKSMLKNNVPETHIVESYLTWKYQQNSTFPPPTVLNTHKIMHTGKNDLE